MASPLLKNTVVCQENAVSFNSVFLNALHRLWQAVKALPRYVISTPPLWIPLVGLAVFTLIFRYTDTDLTLARLFYHEAGDGSSWPTGDVQPWVGLYDYGVYPAWILGAGGLAVWLLAFVWKRIQPIRDEGLFLALVLLLGPGLLINGILKPFCGRPRPIMTKQLGGEYDFLPVFSTGDNLKSDCNSFPSGHASTGFYLMAPAFVLYRRRNGWAAAFLTLGLAAGTIIGIARMAAGGHYVSDIVWAGGIVYFTALLLAAPFRFTSRGKSFSAEPTAT